MSEESKIMKISITPKVYEKIMEYAQSCDLEISGLGSVNQSSGVFDRLFPLYPQNCSGADTEISEEFLREITESGQSARANVWWHSHVMMGVFWSGQDNATIEALGQTYNWLLSVVVNKRREYEARFDIFKPSRATIKVSLVWHYIFPFEEIERIRNEVKDKVNKNKKESKNVHYVPELFQRQEFLKHLGEEELKDYGYKKVNNVLVKMSTEEYIQYQKGKDKNGTGRGSEDQRTLFEDGSGFGGG